MAIIFPPEYIDELLVRIDLTALMEEYGVTVKRGSGRYDFYVADFCCGKTDFDNGRINKGRYHFECHACQTSGNAIHFLRTKEGLTFYEAVRQLSQRANLEMPRGTSGTNEAVDPKRARQLYALKLAADFYERQNNYEYFLSRGISLEVLKKFHAGYAPGGRTLRTHLEEQGFTKEELREFALINKKGHDKFYGRAIIPIIMNGEVVDLYGRAIDDEKNGIKHLYLYGVSFLGGYDFLQADQVVTIYESYIDQLVAESAGIPNGVNAGGANKFSVEHGRLLHRKHIRKAIVIYDGDDAGDRGALEVGRYLEERQIETYIVRLPNGQDPAQLILEKGLSEFRGAAKAIPYAKFVMRMELQKYSLDEIRAYINEMEQVNE